MKPTLGLRVGQSLTMTPALQQAIRMLQLSSVDLSLEIQQVLDSNLMLEQPDEFGETVDLGEGPAADAEPTPADEARADDAIPDDPGVDFEWDDVYAGSSSDRAAQEALYEYRQASLTEAPDLHAHLSEQARVAGFDDAQAVAAEYLIDSVDDRGYLTDWDELCERIAGETGLDGEQIEAVLKAIQQFDPTGIAARDLRECLLLQLAVYPDHTPALALASALVDEHLDAIAEQKPPALARMLDVEVEEIESALSLIRGLQPHPGTPFANARTEYIAPDVFVRRDGDDWVVSLNPEIAPRLRINGHYQKLIKRADQSPDQQTLRQHLQEARYFLNSLKSRNETLLRVAEAIVDRQRAFLEYGDEAMKPMVLRDIAELLGVHESTVSRATAHKYMHTPRGLYELKYFFSSSVQSAEGGSCSATAIQAMIKRLVGGENPAKPLSDSKLTQLLLDEGVRVARRTVAKYREGLGIPPSHERRETA